MAFFSLKFAYQVFGLFGLNFRLGSQFAVPAMAAAGHYWPVDFFNLMAAMNLRRRSNRATPSLILLPCINRREAAQKTVS